MKQPTHKVKSADRVLDIFELFTVGQDSYSLTEISKLLNMPSSSTYLILQNMLNRGYLEVDKSGKQFKIGYKLFMLRSRYSQGTSLSDEFYRIAEKMIAQLNETVNLSIRVGNELRYIGEKTSTNALRYTPNLGESFPLHATASGKILLATLTVEQLREIYPSDQLEQVTDRTISSFDDLLIELEKVKASGYGYNRGETVTGVTCVAGAVLDGNNKVAAAISISIPDVRVTEESWSIIHHSIKSACEELSQKVYS
ncbi:IclR family transcriptional regulator [Cohnella silvisoli]|uniref:IclR family transcriptional regulator n=1 Tax=Cohnella silvisoli TaxID=2873699 RepID=A0ABV1KXE5_9BACL|nr:IclR family transcriptional regulator [Cohnella silvisoli]